MTEVPACKNCKHMIPNWRAWWAPIRNADCYNSINVTERTNYITGKVSYGGYANTCKSERSDIRRRNTQRAPCGHFGQYFEPSESWFDKFKKKAKFQR